MADRTRAQTTLDFAIAMGVFLLAVAFVFAFVPTLTSPFVDGTQDHTAAADRIASHLAEGALGDPSEPYVVQESCVTAFFDEVADDEIPDACGFSGNTTREHLGISDRLDVSVELLRYDGDRTATVHERVGNSPPEGTSTTVARRVVTLDGCDIEDATACDFTLRVVVY